MSALKEVGAAGQGEKRSVALLLFHLVTQALVDNSLLCASFLSNAGSFCLL